MRPRLQAAIVATFSAGLALALAGCGNSAASACLAARSPAVGACSPSTFVDATQSDPVCLDAVSGTAICRGADDAVCYVCTGADFTDGCEVHSTQTIECVHSCDKC